jgi:hypothetical protein
VPRWIVQNVPAWCLVVLAVVGLPALAVSLQSLIRRRVPTLADGAHNDAAGFLGSVVGVIYAIVAGFMVITLWEQYVTAGDTVQNETVSLRDVVQFSGAFGPAAQENIRLLVVRYAKSVATVEWQEMAQGGGSPAVQKEFDQLITAIQGLSVHNPTEEAFLSNMLTQADDVGKQRQQRLELAGQNVPAILWVAVVLASIVTLGFCLLFGIKSARLHYLMVASVTVLIGATLVLILLLEYPFSGTVAVRPTPFEHIAEDLGAASGNSTSQSEFSWPAPVFRLAGASPAEKIAAGPGPSYTPVCATSRPELTASVNVLKSRSFWSA